MKNRRTKITSLFFIIALFGLIYPYNLSAGALKDKIQQRINAPRNIQLQKGAQQYDVRDDSGVVSEREEMKFAAVQPLPGPILSDYAIYRTEYKAELEENVVTVQGEVLFEVFRKGWTKLPLVHSDVGLIDVAVNKGASFVVMERGKYYLMVDKAGRYNLDLEFLIKAKREREGGPGSFSFEVMPAPISQFEFAMPETEVQIFVEPSIKVEIKEEAKRTVAWAVMPNTDSIQVRWTKALPKEEIKPVKLEPKVYVDVATYAALGEGVIRCQSSLSYSILQSEISNPRIALPEDVSVLEVKGRDLRDWKVYQKAGQQYLDVYLNFGVKGTYVLDLTYERNIGEGSGVAEVPWIKALDVEREKGLIGVAASTNVELAANKLEHATVIDIRELPSSIWTRTTNPILLAFKYLGHPFAIHLDVTRHEELPVLVAAIDSADYATLLTEEGKILNEAIYQVRNNVKQFLRISLPKGATLWSSFVGSKPVKAAKDKDGNILIPLEKSQLYGEQIAQFPVEIVYLDENVKMGLMGQLKLKLPQTDIPISQLNWATYLPLDYRYLNFDGDVKPVKQPLRRQVALLRKAEERRKRPIGTQSAAPQQMLFEQVDELQQRGVLPIKIKIPRQGRLYNFSKLLVTGKDTPWISVNYFSTLKKTYGFIWVIIIIAILIFIGLSLKKRLTLGKAQI